MNTIRKSLQSAKKQSGAVLAVSLMILLVLTVLTVTSNRTVLLQNKMAEAAFSGQITLQVAESAIRDAEAFIDTLNTTANFDNEGTNGLYSQGDGPADLYNTSIWTGTTTGGQPRVATSSSYSMQQNNISAAYFIEDLGDMSLSEEGFSGVNMLGYGQTTGSGDVNAFRIVARARGNAGDAERIVEVYYGRRL